MKPETVTHRPATGNRQGNAPRRDRGSFLGVLFTGRLECEAPLESGTEKSGNTETR